MLVVLGSGKSVVFQIGTISSMLLQRPAICLVIQPLISLMMDQLDKLRQCAIPCVRLAQDDESLVTMEEINNAAIVFSSPEAILEKYRFIFEDAVFSKRLVCVAVDECHIISEWYVSTLHHLFLPSTN